MFELDCSEIAAKIMNKYKKNNKTIDIFELDRSENHEKIQKITKQLTFLNWIATKIMKKYKT